MNASEWWGNVTETNTLFMRRKANRSRLQAFGFSEVAGGHVYTTALLDEQFVMTVTVTGSGTVVTDVIENASGESYVLHRVSGASGAFVGQVREAHAHVLTQIAGACFEPDVFKSEGAGQVIQYVRETYQNELEYLWPRFPDNAIVRRSDNARWYLAMLTVRKDKLGLPGNGTLEIMNLRMQPDDVTALVDGLRYLPGWHMNKKHWVTLCLEAPAPTFSLVSHEELFTRIDASFALAAR